VKTNSQLAHLEERKKQIEMQLLQQQKKMESHIKNMNVPSTGSFQLSSVNGRTLVEEEGGTSVGGSFATSSFAGGSMANGSILTIRANEKAPATSEVSPSTGTASPYKSSRKESYELKTKASNFGKNGLSGKVHVCLGEQEVYLMDLNNWQKGTLCIYKDGSKKTTFEAIKTVIDPPQFRILETTQGRTLAIIDRQNSNRYVIKPMYFASTTANDPTVQPPCMFISGDFKEGKFVYSLEENLIGECTRKSSYRKLGKEYYKYNVDIDETGYSELLMITTCIGMGTK
jgi:hypothetical protein